MPPPPSPPPPSWPNPTLSLRVDDLAHPGAAIFFASVDPTTALADAVRVAYATLYTPASAPTHVAAVLLVLRAMPGVAHTTGSRTHKEIHLSLDHVRNSAARACDEIRGVLTHEAVHCVQGDGGGTAPGGLIEGVADFVRLGANLSPPHWKREGGDRWDAGYQTTAYFLEWIEERYGAGTVRELNQAIVDAPYTEDIFKQATGRRVDKLWKLYCAHLEEGKETTPV